MRNQDLIYYYGAAGEFTAARDLWDQVSELAHAHPEEPALREERARGTVHLFIFAEHWGEAAARQHLIKAVDADAELAAALKTLCDQSARVADDNPELRAALGALLRR